MGINIDADTLKKFYECIDSTFDIFGVICLLVYIEKVEEISNTFNNIPSNISVNAHRKTQEQFARSGVNYKEIEKTEEIKLKAYWDSKYWIKTQANILIPDNSIMTIFFTADLPKVERAKELIIHKGVMDSQKIAMKKIGQPFPTGLKQDHYYACYWGQK